jgi:hypothetical protein
MARHDYDATASGAGQCRGARSSAPRVREATFAAAQPLCLPLLAALALSPLAATAETPKYRVGFDAQMAHANVRVCLDHAHAHVAFAPDLPGAMRYFSAMHRSSAGGLSTDGSPWRADNWRAGECLEYRADIGAIADQHSDEGSRYGDSLATDPQDWLLRADVQGASGAEAEVELPEGWSISAPWRELGRDGRSMRFHIPDTPPDWSATLLLGHFEERRIELPGGVLRVAILLDDVHQRERLLGWVRRVAQTLTAVYGRMPVPDVQVEMIPVAKLSPAGRFAEFLYPSAVFGGESSRGQGNSLQLVVDPRRPDKEFTQDWTAIHELSHLMHPYLGDRGSWLGEGLATYYQNVLRARGGMLTATQAWERLADGFRRGGAGPFPDTLEQAAADMNHSHAFNRVYWSGAAYWLSVDVELRRASGGQRTLDSVLSRFGTCCLPAYGEWKPEDFVAKLDALSGVRIFSRRYREFAALRRFPDWHAAFERLGVRVDADAVTFEAGARDAAIRDAITARNREPEGVSLE